MYDCSKSRSARSLVCVLTLSAFKILLDWVKLFDRYKNIVARESDFSILTAAAAAALAKKKEKFQIILILHKIHISWMNRIVFVCYILQSTHKTFHFSVLFEFQANKKHFQAIEWVFVVLNFLQEQKPVI